MKTYDIIQNLESSEYLPESPSNNPEENDVKPVISSPAYAKLAQRIMSSTANSASSSKTQKTFKQKLILLPASRMISLDTDILEYFKNTALDDDIFKVMNVVLAVPASQVSVEGALSAIAITLTELESHVNYNALNNLLITKFNFSEINANSIQLDFANEEEFN